MWKHTRHFTSFPVAQTDSCEVQEGWQNVTELSSPADMVQMGVWGQLSPLHVPHRGAVTLPGQIIPAWLCQRGCDAPESFTTTLNCGGGGQPSDPPKQPDFGADGGAGRIQGDGVCFVALHISTHLSWSWCPGELHKSVLLMKHTLCWNHSAWLDGPLGRNQPFLFTHLNFIDFSKELFLPRQSRNKTSCPDWLNNPMISIY